MSERMEDLTTLTDGDLLRLYKQAQKDVPVINDATPEESLVAQQKLQVIRQEIDRRFPPNNHSAREDA